MTSNNKPSSLNVVKGEETGTLIEHVDLSSQIDPNKSESEMLLPHERD